MSTLPPATLSLATLASLAELGPAAPASPAAGYASGGGNVFSAAPVTTQNAEKSVTYPGSVTGVPVLPPQDDVWMEREERAAILEYDGGWPRPVAEMIANKLMPLKKMDSTSEEMRTLDRELIDLEQQTKARSQGRRALQR